VQAEVNALLERKLRPNPLVTIHQYPEADHAFARIGGIPYRRAEAEEALGHTLTFFAEHLAKDPR
jgi:carboxymethylenebutenolidase